MTLSSFQELMGAIIPIGLVCLALFCACGNDDDDDENDAQMNTNSTGKIVFVSNRVEDEQIYAMNADGTDVTKLTDIHNDEAVAPPFFSPNLPFLENVATHGEFNLQPTWSPDGTKIAFVSTRDGNNEIYVMNADGSNPINLTNNPASDLYPEWSPDGTKIAFVSGRDGNAEIYVMNADGSQPVNITNHPKNDTTPSWSPN